MRELICIGCPMGCVLKAEMKGEEITVSGNNCKRGEKYARNEILHPVRSVTSTVKVLGGTIPRLPVRTAGEIPKEKIFDCMAEIKRIRVNAPIRIGDLIIENCAGTGIDIIAARNIEKI